MNDFNTMFDDTSVPQNDNPNEVPQSTPVPESTELPEPVAQTAPIPVPAASEPQAHQQATPPAPDAYRQAQPQYGANDFYNNRNYDTPRTSFDYPKAQVRQDPTKRRPTPRTYEMPTNTSHQKSNIGKTVAIALLACAVGVGGGMLLNRNMPRRIAESIVSDTEERQVEIPTATRTVDTSTPVAVASKALPSVVSIHTKSGYMEGLGSGVIINDKGDIITNYHVIEDMSSIGVTIGTETYTATVVGSDPSSDIAVIHLDENVDVTPIAIGNSDELEPGSWVMTIGSPFGLEQSVSAGIVSAISRNTLMPSTSGNTVYANLIQTDATINPGNSGGALVNEQGELVGIPTLFSSDTESFAGVGFAIPGNYALEIANKIIAGEDITHAYIGLSMQTVTEDVAEQLKLNITYGAYVTEVNADSPAEKAGIKTGDIITAIDGKKITAADDVVLMVRTYQIGDTVEVTLMRNNKEMTMKVTLSDDATLQQLQREQNAFRDQEPIRDYEKNQDQQNYQEYMVPDDEMYYDETDPFSEDWQWDQFFDYLMDNRDKLM